MDSRREAKDLELEQWEKEVLNESAKETIHTISLELGAESFEALFASDQPPAWVTDRVAQAGAAALVAAHHRRERDERMRRTIGDLRDHQRHADDSLRVHDVLQQIVQRNDVPQDLAAAVQHERDWWEAIAGNWCLKRHRHGVDGKCDKSLLTVIGETPGDHGLTAPVIFDCFVSLRRDFRRRLRANWGLDARRMRFLRCARPPQTEYQTRLFVFELVAFRTADTTVAAMLAADRKARANGDNHYIAALNAMIRAQEEMSFTLGWLMDGAPFLDQRFRAQMSLSGLLRARMNLQRNLRLATALDGLADKDPPRPQNVRRDEALKQSIPLVLPDCWARRRPGSTLRQLVNDVANAIIRMAQSRRSPDNSRSAGSRRRGKFAASREIKDPGAERGIEEFIDREILHEHLRPFGLTELEQEVYLLRHVDKLKYREIAEATGHRIGTIGPVLSDAQRKIDRVTRAS